MSLLIWINRRRKQEVLTDTKMLLEGPDKPQHLEIELSNLCNADCVFCGYQYQERPKIQISFSNFEKAIREYVALGGGNLGLTPTVGDALIDKEIVKKVKFARSFKEIGEIGITTNGILLTRQLYEELVDAGVSFIYLSMSGFDREEYRKVYRNDSYLRVTKNLEDIATSPSRPRCMVIITIRTLHPFPWMKKDYKKFKKLNFPIARTYLYDSWSGRIKSKHLPGFMFVRPSPPKTTPCVQLYTSTMVYSNGNLGACACRDLNANSELIVGNIQKNTIDEAWKNGALNKLRQRFIDGDLPDVCKDCCAYNPITKQHALDWKFSNPPQKKKAA